MLQVLIPSDIEFKKYETECRNLYEANQDKICDPNSFEFIVNQTFFYMFVDSDGDLIGAIYYFEDEDGKLFLNGFAKRKKHLLNLECLKLSTTWFSCDIYAEAQNKMSALCLRKCGFKEITKGIYIFKRKE